LLFPEQRKGKDFLDIGILVLPEILHDVIVHFLLQKD
jgi:hypothetical protein